MVTQEYIKDFLAAAHFDLAKVKEVLAAHPELIDVQYDWAAVI
jgi:hypothetical protein